MIEHMVFGTREQVDLDIGSRLAEGLRNMVIRVVLAYDDIDSASCVGEFDHR